MNNTLKETFDSLKQYSLSGADILDFEPTKIHLYSNIIDKLFLVDSLFDLQGRCVILYPTQDEKTGHWTCLIKKGNTIEWYEPYGITPITRMGRVLKSKVPLNPRYLIRKIKADGYKFVQNKTANQPLSDKDNNTCGRWVTLRLALSKLDNIEFQKTVLLMSKKHNMNPNKLVILFTHT